MRACIRQITVEKANHNHIEFHQEHGGSCYHQVHQQLRQSNSKAEYWEQDISNFKKER